MRQFSNVISEFKNYHKNPVNKIMHIFSTSLGFISFISVSKQILESPIVYTCIYLYNISLINELPLYLWCMTTITLEFMIQCESLLNINLLYGILLLIFSVLFQDLAHLICNEKTYESSYSNKSGKFVTYINHVYYLLPCILEVTNIVQDTIKTIFIRQNHVLHGKINEIESIESIHKWVINHEERSKEQTTHWWYETLPSEQKESFRNIVMSRDMSNLFYSKFDYSYYTVEPITKMNEIYVASEKYNKNSDTVFFMNHIDGPFYLFFPFCRVYRCIFAINENKRISTKFPSIDKKYTLTTGDIVAFDFNREIHIIECNEQKENKECRITLKLHYVVYPKILNYFGKILKKLTTIYDINARKLFLATINPKESLVQKVSDLIIYTTDITYLIENYIGFYNLSILILTFYIKFDLLATFITYFYYFYNLFNHEHPLNDEKSLKLYQRDVVLYEILSNIVLLINFFKYISDYIILTTLYILLRPKENSKIMKIINVGIVLAMFINYIYRNEFNYVIYIHNIMYLF